MSMFLQIKDNDSLNKGVCLNCVSYLISCFNMYIWAIYVKSYINSIKNVVYHFYYCLWIVRIMSDDDVDCIFCGLLVNSESNGIECDNCQSWTHIECDTCKSILLKCILWSSKLITLT